MHFLDLEGTLRWLFRGGQTLKVSGGKSSTPPQIRLRNFQFSIPPQIFVRRVLANPPSNLGMGRDGFARTWPGLAQEITPLDLA